MQLKIKEAQTFSLSEQLRIRDDIIARTRNALKDSLTNLPTQGSPGSRSGSMSSRQNTMEGTGPGPSKSVTQT